MKNNDYDSDLKEGDPLHRRLEIFSDHEPPKGLREKLRNIPLDDEKPIRPFFAFARYAPVCAAVLFLLVGIFEFRRVNYSGREASEKVQNKIQMASNSFELDFDDPIDDDSLFDDRFVLMEDLL